MSYRQTLEGLLERAHKPERRAYYETELDCPPLPSSLIYLWKIFIRLSSRRGSSGFGINPISWPEIDAFVRFSKFHLSPWEIEMLELIDNLYCAEVNSSTPAMPATKTSNENKGR